jgi:hypothetical protein
MSPIPNKPRPDKARRGHFNWAMMAVLSFACFGTAQASSLDEHMTISPDQTANQPITLIVRQNGPLVEAQVVSASSCQCGGRFRIESESGSSNRSDNSSSFREVGTPGKVLSNIRFGGSDNWSVRLTVSIDGREDYTIHRSSDENH